MIIDSLQEIAEERGRGRPKLDKKLERASRKKRKLSSSFLSDASSSSRSNSRSKSHSKRHKAPTGDGDVNEALSISDIERFCNSDPDEISLNRAEHKQIGSDSGSEDVNRRDRILPEQAMVVPVIMT